MGRSHLIGVPKDAAEDAVHVDPRAVRIYARAMERLNAAGVEYVVGGAHALAKYSGISRDTKDLDLFLRREDIGRGLDVLAAAGYTTDLPFPHWLGKASQDEYVIDLIFSSGNGVASVDDEWFGGAVEEVIFGVPARLCPPEEMIWSKAFIMERERFDGADVAHIIRWHGRRLDWPHMLRRFDRDWRVLLAQLILFEFIYPGHRDAVPEDVLQELLARLATEAPADLSRLCRGTVLSRAQYLVDVQRWGYEDARLEPHGNMTPEETQIWTDAIEGE